jgi:hypothetical protein
MVRDLNDLQFFAAVVQNSGFSAAARILGVPKSRDDRAGGRDLPGRSGMLPWVRLYRRP